MSDECPKNNKKIKNIGITGIIFIKLCLKDSTTYLESFA